VSFKDELEAIVGSGHVISDPLDLEKYGRDETEDLIAYTKECCVTRELRPEERQQFGLPER